MGGYKCVQVPIRPERPLLPSVTRAVVLSMERGSRLTRESLADLCAICPRTWVQLNPGWEQGGKPAHVTSTAHDLVDAYRHACAGCADVDGPVLLLEEDALLLEHDAAAFERVDAFLRSQPYDVYSLGSFGEFGPADARDHHRRFVGRMGFSQAIVWSRRARDALLRRPVGDVHIDVHTISALELKYGYRKPLVVQLFPRTKNMQTWCLECDGSVRERILVNAWKCFLQKVLRLDRRTSGWKVLYAMNGGIRHVRRGTHALGAVVLYSLTLLVVFLGLRERGAAAPSSALPHSPPRRAAPGGRRQVM